MLTTLLRIVKYGIQSFRRNAITSIATIVVLTIALLLFQGLIVFREIKNTAVVSLQDKIDISVYFKLNVAEDSILTLSESLAELDEVKSVEYISRERALEVFEEKYADDPTISQALEELEANPLLASLNIKAYDPNDYEGIAAFLDDPSFATSIEKVTFTESQVAIERLNRLIAIAEKVGFGLALFLAVTAILVTFNTIRLAIYSNRDEIGIMRLVGASNVFINGPYIVESVIFGALAAVITMLLTIPVINFTAEYVHAFIPEMNLTGYFFGNFLSLLGYQLLFGVILATISGIIAIRRYLKV